MNKRLINIVLLGAPGCGKGTQAAFIKEKYDLEHVSTGALYREEMASGSAIGNFINFRLYFGLFVSRMS